MRTECQRWSIYAAVAALAFLVSAQPSPALTDEEQWENCLQQRADAPDDVISACRYVLANLASSPNVVSDAYNNIGVAWIKKGEPQEAIRAYSNSLRALRSYRAVRGVEFLQNITRENRARTYFQIGEYDDALDDLDYLILADEKSAKYHAMRCMYLGLTNRDLDKAGADCAMALAHDGIDGDARSAQILLDIRGGRDGEALEICRKGRILNPQGVYLCGILELRIGDVKTGQHYLGYARVLQTDIAEFMGKFGIRPDPAPTGAAPEKPKDSDAQAR